MIISWKYLISFFDFIFDKYDFPLLHLPDKFDLYIYILNNKIDFYLKKWIRRMWLFNHSAIEEFINTFV